MGAVQKEVMLRGLECHQMIIDGIIEELNLEAYAFDIRLILIEAVTNAYYHGNLSDCSKPITIRYLLRDKLLKLQIEDSGAGGGVLLFPETISNEELLEDGGRGLYLIRCFSDTVERVDNTMYISKSICSS
ncbi:ATP-binding protein [Paenibacillus sp. MMS20-IR301]|uniref:ATP-binding protein n=1 Tax=Paenibacillus sp. MMS20-IR301 TaxID=2895946 RepID=UPI0028E7356A|nr:ATP-binding protein [Paenibacillus sp. MMS20-IR301]WNS44609.1 ATP-binding protein [Paenibacillus sp. MMS20-IR301]